MSGLIPETLTGDQVETRLVFKWTTLVKETKRKHGIAAV